MQWEINHKSIFSPLTFKDSECRGISFINLVYAAIETDKVVCQFQESWHLFCIIWNLIYPVLFYLLFYLLISDN